MLVPIISIAIVIVVALGIIFLVGKGLGPPQVPKFDDTPADVQQLDVKP